MDFLDNLENSLKNLERQEERDPNAQRRQNEARKQALDVAPWAEKLKTSQYTQALFEQAALAGHRLRSKIYIAWLGSVLRLEVRGRWCELRPASTGIHAEYVTAEGTTANEEINLSESPRTLLSNWLGEGAISDRSELQS